MAAKCQVGPSCTQWCCTKPDEIRAYTRRAFLVMVEKRGLPARQVARAFGIGRREMQTVLGGFY